MKFYLYYLLNFIMDNNNLELIENNLKDLLNNIVFKLNNIEERLNKLERNNSSNFDKTEINENIIELKKELINIDDNTIKKALLYKDHRSVLYIFKSYYKNKTNITQYPIKIKSQRVFEYYLNNKWISDNNGHYIKDTLFMNIQTLFYKVNNIDNYEDTDDIYNNQIFINKLSEDKYKKQLFKYIIDEIKNCL